MRIAIYHNLLSGGAKRTLYEEVRRLSGKHQIDIYAPSSANHQFADVRPYVDRYQTYDFPITPLLNSPFGRINQGLRLLDLIRLRQLTKKIAEEISKSNYDVCLVHPCQYESSPSILRHIKTTPTVYYCHEPLRRFYEEMPKRPYLDNRSTLQKSLDRIDPLIYLYQSILKKTDRQNLRSATKVLVNSHFVQKAVHQIYGILPEVSYHGIDVEYFKPRSEQRKNFILSVGSLTPLKGFDFLIHSLAHIPEEIRPSLVIISNFQNMPERQYLQEIAKSKDVELKIEVNISDDALLQRYSQAKLTAYSSIREPFGLVPLESMACGTPVVAVRDGGVQETIIDGQTGVLVDRDPEKFANAVQSLLSDPDRAARYGRDGRQHVLQHWTWDRAVRTLETHLTAAASQPTTA